MNIVQPCAPLIHIDSQTYPLYIKDLAERHKDTSFGSSVTEEELSQLGYAVVVMIDPPQGVTYTKLQPVEIDGAYKECYAITEPLSKEPEQCLGIAKQALLQECFLLKERSVLVGAPFAFASQDKHWHVQISAEDRITLISLIARVNACSEHGDALVSMVLRTKENEWVSLTPAQMVSVCTKALEVHEAIVRQVCGYKDTIARAKCTTELPTLPQCIDAPVCIVPDQ